MQVIHESIVITDTSVLINFLNLNKSDVSQMENGTRKIGRVIAKRIEQLFDVDYRSFLE